MGSGDPVALRQLVDAIHGLDAEPLSAHTAQPRYFCGGADWETVLGDGVVRAVGGIGRVCID